MVWVLVGVHVFYFCSGGEDKLGGGWLGEMNLFCFTLYVSLHERFSKRMMLMRESFNRLLVNGALLPSLDRSLRHKTIVINQYRVGRVSMLEGWM